MFELSPYFKSLAATPRVCPRCHARGLRLQPLELTWDAAVWRCDSCKWFQTVLAPESAKLGQRGEPKARIIPVDFGSRR